MPQISVVIPCYRVKRQIADVLSNIGPEVSQIFIIDDVCPDSTGDFVRQNFNDPRITVLVNRENLGVGGAVIAGYRVAVASGADVIVKIDGDGQMNPRIIPKFVAPIIRRQADYTKGNRFYDLKNISRMPSARIFGNTLLSFMTKLSTGYWHIFDPTNGFTAIDARLVPHLPLDQVSKRYFFESDMLFRLNTIRAVVMDIPMDACYGEEQSNLKILSVIPDFLFKHTSNFLKRVVYNYFLRDMTLASLELVLGVLLMTFGVVFGGIHWVQSVTEGASAPLGTIMLAALPVLVGLQFILAFLGYDISNIPRNVVSAELPDYECNNKSIIP
ncbi:MAG: glycosyltransferase family 2 protein [Chlorobiaceae bacterium]|nr:glycosyltransferase family 2 protein [Chlorobiaceae bacterium]